MTDPRLKIAVFIDFDNIEIGVKTTLNQQFDIGIILEALKERGEVITKVAYGDWKRAGDHSRLLSQHAIRMVQRNLTPGGDKNGADINLALDALEMAFTHDHINAFVVVGGDSDFITLVEKLKQYDKKVFVVGGRQFTSLVMQRNCHEFITYENLVGAKRPASTGTGRSRAGGATSASDLEKALPLVKRALKVLADREVTPQLGLLKSTLLQLDSTFSERDYGASTFRDFIEKVAERGFVTLRQAGRSVLVELSDGDADAATPESAAQPPASESTDARTEGQPAESSRAESPRPDSPRGESRRDAPVPAAEGAGAQPAAASPEQAGEGVRTAARLFGAAKQAPRWPMYMRQVRQYLRAVDEGFDERRFGFSGVVEFLRACQREGLLRLDRDRQGVLRVFAGPNFPKTHDLSAEAPQEAGAAEEAFASEPYLGGQPQDVPVIEAEPIDIEPPPPSTLDGEAALSLGEEGGAQNVEEVTEQPRPTAGARRARKTTRGGARKTATPRPARTARPRKAKPTG